MRTVQITAGELTVMSGALTDLAEAQMPAGVGYHIARLTQKLGAEIGIILDRQAAIMHKYKAEKVTGEKIRMTPQNPNFKKARDEMNDLLSQEVTIEAEIIIIPADVSLKPGTLTIMEKFIKVFGT